MKKKLPSPQPEIQLEGRIHLMRSQRVVLDRDLAALYGVTTYRLNEQVKRNKLRFPKNLYISLDESRSYGFEIAICDLKEARRSQNSTPCLYRTWGGNGSDYSK